MKEHKTIDLPRLYDINTDVMLGKAICVGNDQPVSAHKAVEQLAIYFKREFHYDYTQYTAFEDKDNDKSNAYIWLDSDWESNYAIGAAVFRYLTDVGDKPRWVMQFVWFHPYYRRAGLLTETWKHFQEKYGDFDLEEPVSDSMRKFVKKMGEKS